MSALLFFIFTLSQLVASGPVARRSTLAAGCDSATRSLAIGVQDSIAIEYQELSIATQLSNTLAINPVDVTSFNVQQAQLYFTVQKAILIRQNNQIIPISNPAVIQGLNNVAISQQLELLAVQNLGVNNQIQTSLMVNNLRAAFIEDINQNTNSLTQLLSQCPGGIGNNGLGATESLQSSLQNSGILQNGGNLNGNIQNGGILNGNIQNGGNLNGNIQNGGILNGNIQNGGNLNGNIQNGGILNGNIQNGGNLNGNIQNSWFQNSGFPNTNFQGNGNSNSNIQNGGNIQNNGIPNGNRQNGGILSRVEIGPNDESIKGGDESQKGSQAEGENGITK